MGLNGLAAGMDAASLTDYQSSDDESGAYSDTAPSPLDPEEADNSTAFKEFLQIQARERSISDSTPSVKPNPERYESIIDKARDYQQELFDRAKEENIIAVLDTGSGKTLIAALLIKHFLQQELINRAEGKPPQIVFFLVNSVHLARQQARFLDANLPCPVIPLFGGTTEDLWRKADWDKIFADNNVVVCTAAVLDNCLMHSYLIMEQISLLIFDEAHHCKKNHPYSRIIRDYYIKCKGPRPRIFGMTASPVDSKRDIAQVANDLEALLQSKIVTTNDLSIFDFAPKAEDVLWKYPQLYDEYDTDLCGLLRPLCGFIDDLMRYFDFSRQATRQLGLWAADRVWKHAMTTTYETSIKASFERSRLYQTAPEQRERLWKSVQDAMHLVENHPFGPPDLGNDYDLSPKVRYLYARLSHQYAAEPTTRAIVFLDQRLSAFVLCDCFELLDIPHLRPGVLVGVGQKGPESSSWKDQEAVMENFRDGRINLIFSTSVAEEGIDIPQCNFVVRFDLYKTPIQYMQSRGRARMKDSTYAHMLEEDNTEHEANVNYAMEMDGYIRKFCQQLPPDRKLGQGSRLRRLLAKDASRQSFMTRTGVIANYNNALVLLSRYADSLRIFDAQESEIYKEIIDLEDNMFKYQVKLPDTNSEQAMRVRVATGDAKTNKVLAKRSAAFKCCMRLRAAELLDDNLDSVFKKVKPDNLNARIAVSEKKDYYEKKLKPDFWAQSGVGSEIPSTIYATRIIISSLKNREDIYHFMLFTRALLPKIPVFSVFLRDNIEHHVVFETVARPFKVSTEQVEALTRFTLTSVFEDMFNKVYEPDAHLMSYWLAPSSQRLQHVSDASHLGQDGFQSLVDVSQLEAAFSPERERWSTHASKCQTSWLNKYLVDPGNGAFHYFTNKVVPGATIWDQPPASAMRVPKRHKNTIIEFTDSTWRRKSKDLKSFADRYDPEQPVLEATLIISGRNWLDKTPEGQTKMASCYIAAQPLEVGRISTTSASALQLWPSILHRLEAFLIVREALQKLGLQDVPLDLALQAFTQDTNGEADGSGGAGNQLDIDHDDVEDYSDAYRRVSSNYERLEFIGDSLLKMMTTITVYNRTTCNEEGMHCKRMAMLSNSRLYSVASKPDYELFRHIRGGRADQWRDTWYPEFLKQTKGRFIKLTDKHRKHALGKKTIADVCEATIGACIMATQHLPASEKFDLGINAITKLVEDQDHSISSWKEVAPMYKPPAWSLVTNDPVANDLANKVYEITGYRFKHPCLLRSAFTHPSDQRSPVQDLQRLEFLGDACLDWVCIWWLFSTNQTRGPQWLTEHKMAMVSNKFLAALAVTLGFNKLISASHIAFSIEIATYAREVQDAYEKDCVKPDFWTKISTSPPKALADLVESYLGAVLVDSGFDFTEIEKFFNERVLWFFKDIRAYDTFANRHPTTFLFRLLKEQFKCQKSSLTKLSAASDLPTRDVQDGDGAGDEAVAGITEHVGWVVHGKVISASHGQGFRYARVRASKAAVEVLGKLTLEEFRQRYGCDCAQKKIKGVDEHAGREEKKHGHAQQQANGGDNMGGNSSPVTSLISTATPPPPLERLSFTSMANGT